MLDSADSSRPERHSDLIAENLERLNVDIAVLCKVRFLRGDCLRKHGAGYTLYWTGKLAVERRISIASKLENLPADISNCIISVQFSLSNQQYATFFSMYSPNFQADLSEKEYFYSDSLVTYKVIILYNINARVG